MEALKIHSQMAHFRLIRRIDKVSAKGIWGEAKFERAPLYAGLEAMAQLAALHVRQRLQFERHAFLLRVQGCQMPAADLLEGPFRIGADLRSQSSNTFGYDAVALGPQGIDFKSRLLIGTRDYDAYFPKNILKAHYQGILAKVKE
jgi:hypothetical protein